MTGIDCESRILKNPTSAGGILYTLLRKNNTVTRKEWAEAIAKSDRVTTARIAEHDEVAKKRSLDDRIRVAIHNFAEIGEELIYDREKEIFTLGRKKRTA